MDKLIKISKQAIKPTGGNSIMLFKVKAGSILCGILAVGVTHTFYPVGHGLVRYRTNRVAKIAGYKRLSLERVL